MRKEKLLNLIYQGVIAICSIIAIVFIIIDIIHFFPVCVAYRYSLSDIQPIFYKTSVGKVVSTMLITESNYFIVLAKEAMIAFFRSMNLLVIFFLLIISATLFLKLFYEQKKEGKLYSDNLPYLGKLAFVYILKFLVCAAVFGVTYAISSTIRTIGVGLAIMSYIGIIMNLWISFYLVLFIIKFILLCKEGFTKTLENPQ